jgi:hypothetical protein
MGLLSGGSGLGVGGNPFDWNRGEWTAGAFGGPQFVGAYQHLEEIREGAKPPPPIDPRIEESLESLRLSADNTVLGDAADRLDARMRAAGANPAAAASAAARFRNRGFLDIAPRSVDHMGSLLRLAEESRRRRESIGPTPTVHQSQLDNFLANLG